MLPGDVVLAKREGVIFIPPHLAEAVVDQAERIMLRDRFGHQRLREGKYTPGQIDTKWTKEIDVDFAGVISACAGPRDGTAGTWITNEMMHAYCELHEKGYAHSVEAWEGSTLVGGLYGVDAGGAFSGESMFYLRANASKLALLYLIEHLQKRGLDWIDIQMLTPHLEAMGAREIDRSEFLQKLALTQKRKLTLFGH